MLSKNVIAGLGEIGNPIFKLLSKYIPTIGFDLDKTLIEKKSFEKYSNHPTSNLHICIPFNKQFSSNVLELKKKFDPKLIIIHSTISPGTTKNLQKKLDVPIIYSATCGVHARM
jgi:UDP-N-acetyl-D-mannosaminuronate dehydrogenase